MSRVSSTKKKKLLIAVIILSIFSIIMGIGSITYYNQNGYPASYYNNKSQSSGGSSVSGGSSSGSGSQSGGSTARKTISFGSYPQSKVTDTSITSALDDMAVKPTDSYSFGWQSYGYYIANSPADYMWYIDLDYNNQKYRGVYFMQYRPCYTSSSSSADNSYQDDNYYYMGRTYWFLYEPIKWTVLERYSNGALILSDMILDSQCYYPSYSTRTESGSTVYPNNYAYSAIRKWLNDDFYNTAFNSSEKSRIVHAAVDNSPNSTGSTNNPYACLDTVDDVFLLSYQEKNTYCGNDSISIKGSTSYAKSQGLYVNTSNKNSRWWLRSPVDNAAFTSHFVNYDGQGINYPFGSTSTHLINSVYVTYFGVVPALKIYL